MGEHPVKNIDKPIRVYKVPMGPGDVGKTRTGTKTWKKGAFVGAIILILCATAFAVWHFYFRPPPIEPASIEKMAHPLPDKPSIAVLPFTNMSGNPDQNYIADGISENIISALSKIGEIFVIARNSTFTYKNKAVKVQQVAEDLGVRYVLEGSVLESGNKIRITVQLIDAITGYHLWSEKYDRKIEDFFQLLDEITYEIVVALQVKLTHGEQVRKWFGTTNFEVWSDVAKGLGIFETYTKANNEKARGLFENAVKIDPDCAFAWVMLGWTHFIEVRFAFTKTPAESLKKALQNTKKAQAIDDTLPEVPAALGSIYLIQRQYDKANAEGQKSIELGPNSALSHVLFAQILYYSGNPEKAIALGEQALRLCPTCPAWYSTALGKSYRTAGRYEDAIRVFKEVLVRARKGEFPLWFANSNLAIAYAMMGQYEEARIHLAEALKLNPAYSFELERKLNFYKDSSQLEAIFEALRKAGLPDKKSPAVADKPSIAVLPFDNMSGDPKQEYFSDGITEQIISSLAKVPQLFVIARNSTFTYRGKPIKVQQVAKELGVRYVLEGSVQRSGDRVRITAQLIDARTGNHIWAENYDRDVKDIFALQDEITMKIITAVQVELTAGEAARVRARGTENRQAYDKYMQAQKRLWNFSKEEMHQARKELDEVIALDPNWSSPYAFQAWTHLWDVWRRWSKSPGKSIRKAEELCLKAISLEDENALAHGVLCHVYLLMKKHDESIAEGRRAVALAPNMALAYTYLGTTLSFAGESKEAVDVLKTAIRLNPLPDPVSYFQLGFAYRDLGQYDKAIAACKKAIDINPNMLIPHIILTSIYSMAGRETEARAQAKEVLRINPNFSVGSFSKMIPYKKKADKDRAGDALRKAGLPEKPPEKNSEKPSVAVLGNGLKGKVYTYETPGFSIIYPETLSAGEPDPGCLFTAKGSMFGIPKMNVLKEKAFASPEDVAKDTIRIVEEGKGAKNCKVVYAKKTTLSDGTPAFEIMITWDHPMIPGLYTVKTIAQKGDVIIGASITDDKEISESTIQFLKSLKIE